MSAAYLGSNSAVGTYQSDTVTVSGSGFGGASLIVLAVLVPELTSLSSSSFSTIPPGFEFLAYAAQLNTNYSEGAVALFWGTTVASSYEFVVAGGNGTTPQAHALAFSGTQTSAPSAYTVTNTAGSGASPISVPLGGVTASSGSVGIYLAIMLETGSSGWVWTAPSGWTSAQTTNDNAGSNASAGMYSAYLDALSGGATGTLTATATQSGTQGGAAGIVVSLPASASGLPPSQFFFGSRLLPLAPLAWVIERRRRLTRRS